mmetsp:Transcript_24940/g.53128  ORF Transcript_24940/g.53128 Transcript_24940/m.53128 type:complete len:756 (+) Transcript_24940:44-2311(+)|eukprot:CAMPEP_0172530322 /NCGR_PEP_ID=MMETSP1067-20121228/4088_1 /TAXON_ID=265564 ORGANISM="Thalassiosira punctigera, Strain Tpunct2005C2" /NCGR_SAMPLE_ID=MMETSP1067 /ASSEMBLY_ACC=CAM_ASM_000444 /LENGTH=755 /DNA_ID=CAMNT_0013314501 /DNA_START=7 /DNA_END=2274 /DNA_ORIENTATION=-
MASRTKTAGSVVDVLDRVIGLPNGKENGNDAELGSGGSSSPFISSEKWRGARPGYVFRTSEEFGTGYHIDDGDDGNGAAPAVAAASEVTSSHAGGRERKRARFDSARDTTHVIPARNKKKQHVPTGDELLAEAEAAASSQPHATKLIELTPRGIRSAAQSLERTMRRNQLLRAQHEDDPEKFMMNELALNDEVVSFQAAAVNVGLYGELVESGAAGSFLTLMNHENSDVAISILNVLVELLDPDLLLQAGGKERESLDPSERARSMGLLANSFVDGGGMELLSSNLGRFDESVEEDAKGVEDALSLVESLLDLDRTGVLQGARADDDRDEYLSVVSCICKQTTFLSWLFQRIEKEDDDEEAPTLTASAPVSPAVLKLHASEVMSAILQHEDYSTQRCGERLAVLPKYKSAFDDNLDEKPAAKRENGADGSEKKDTNDGMEALLLAIADFRKSDPQIEVECEFLENIFDALAASLLREDNVLDFVAAEGVELMLRCLRQKVHAGGGALKVLNFALSGSARDDNRPGNDVVCRRACETFVNAGGIKLLFPLYMARKSAIPVPAVCSEGGSDLAKKGKNNNGGGAVSKRAKRAAHARKRWLADVERNAINIVYALTRHVAKDSEYDAHARLLVKFVEEDCEKCDRTIELCTKYDERARVAEYQYFRSDEAEEAERTGVDVELGALHAKLRGGGDMFHRSCAILSFACLGSKRCRGHVMDQLKLQGSGISVIKMGLKEFASLLSDGSQKSQIENYTNEI